MEKGSVIVAVTNDLVTDQRVNRTCTTLTENGYRVLLVGRKLNSSLPLGNRNYATHRMQLLFSRNAVFYAEYNIRLFLFLLFRKGNIYFSNDLDTLPACWLAAKLKGKKLVYDSHEYFTEVPELEQNAFAKKTWKWLEEKLLPSVKYCITVNESIAGLFKEKYGKNFAVVRNVPLPVKEETAPLPDRKALGMDPDKHILILQGSGINIHRGSEELVEAMQWLDDSYQLYILGGGDVIEILKKMSASYPPGKVVFLPRQPYAQLMNYTRNADLGLSLDKANNINYKFSLPNKIFDYIQAGIPVLSSSLPEVSRIVEGYDVGYTLPVVEPQAIADMIHARIFADPETYRRKKENCKIAARTLHWDHEKQVLLDLMQEVNKP